MKLAAMEITRPTADEIQSAHSVATNQSVVRIEATSALNREFINKQDIKEELYKLAFDKIKGQLDALSDLDEITAQKIFSEVLAKAFSEDPLKWSFVGFYDVRKGGDYKDDTIYIGEYVSESIFPCGEIKLGKG